MAQTGGRDDPFAAFNFLVEIENVTVAGFHEVSGLTTETDAIDYRNGNTENVLTKLPGLKKITNIVFKSGYTNSKELWEWRKKVLEGQTERQSGSIVLLNENREEVLRWNFREGWPCKWEGPALNAKNNEVAIESLEVCHEGLVLDS